MLNSRLLSPWIRLSLNELWLQKKKTNRMLLCWYARQDPWFWLSKTLFILFYADLLLGLTDVVIHSIERTIGYMEYGVNLDDFYFILIQNSVLCALQRGFSNTCQLASNFILCAASLDRALVVAKPMLNFRRGKWYCVIEYTCSWLDVLIYLGF